jgi:hypothetical protein
MMWARRASLALLGILAVAGTAGAQAPQVRMKWQDFVAGPDGAKRLASLQAAIKKMKSLDTAPPSSVDYRRSWQYWANIHGYYGPTSPDGTVEQQIQYLQQSGMGKYVPYYQGIADQAAPDTVAQQIWATCQHSGGPGQQAVNFFGWHRMYLYYFERVLRWASGDDTLRLPYWDYTDPTQLALPAEFRQATAVTYDPKRDPGMNAGTASLRSGATNVDALLRNSDYFKYELGIEQGVHGYVHCTVGPTCPVAHMGDVPLAGNDPVFYHHHANIDRLWSCWQNLYGTPKGDWQQQKFSFVDETGTLQTKPVSFVVDTASLGYAYDNVKECARPSALLAAAPPQAKGPRALVHKSPAVPVDQAQTVVDLDIPPARLASAVRGVDAASPVELVLRDVTAESHPGVLFDVFLAKKGAPAERQHVGTISWFGAFRHHGKTGPERRTFEYDVTDALRALGGDALRSTGVSVIIEATEGRDSSDPAEAATLKARAADAFKAAARLRIGAIELHAAPVPPS